MEDLLPALLGVGLAATCGFRIFVPPLVANLAARAGFLHVPADAFLFSDAALVALAVAAVAEVAAYSIPVVDHLLDTVASPVAVVAGTLLAGNLMGDASPLLRWSLALIAGGGAAAAVQGTTVGARLVVGGAVPFVGHRLVALVELASALVGSILVILAPMVALALLLAAALTVRRMLRRRRVAPASSAVIDVTPDRVEDDEPAG